MSNQKYIFHAVLLKITTEHIGVVSQTYNYNVLRGSTFSTVHQLAKYKNKIIISLDNAHQQKRMFATEFIH